MRRAARIEQSRLMEQALKKAGKSVRMTTYRNEGHGGWSHRNELQNLQEIIAFLEPHPAQPAASD